ncbi:nuclear transport factor 2 family protein [Streptomyces sp. NPDC056983]|uniref:nuclear transport factor 2 family protein n=1 Tax=Streptomyces sp. NPDC056983 TaxID=3345987 RepID=UPI0036272B5A
MTDSQNLAVVRPMYTPGTPAEMFKEIIASDAVWDVSPGFLGIGGIHHGFDNVMEALSRAAQNFEAPLQAEAEAFYEDGDSHVIATGTYNGVAKGTGNPVRVRFTHIWTVRGGQIARLRQTVDSLVLDQALRG